LASQKGRLILIKVEAVAGSGTYINVGGLQSKSVKINNELVDVTNSDSNGFRKLLEGAGVNSIEVSGSGTFTDDLGADAVRSAAEDNEHLNFQIICPGDTYSRVYTGRFALADFELSGEHNADNKFTATLQSDGEIVKTRV